MPAVFLTKMAHLVFLCLWGGVVATESVMEILPLWKKEMLKPVAIFHYYIDLFVELPIIMMVALTGLVTLLQMEVGMLHVVKISAGCAAIIANLFCIWKVVERYRMLNQGASEEDLKGIHETIIKSALVGFPLAMVAAGIGFWLASKAFAALLVPIVK
jgi:hypothetical protein